MNALRTIAAITLQSNLAPAAPGSALDTRAWVNSLRGAQRRQPRNPDRPLSIVEKFKRGMAIRFRNPEQGGYIHDTAVSQFFSPGMALHTVGTWTDTVGNVALTYMKRRTGAGATNQLVYPIIPIQNSVALKGSYVKSIDLWYEIGTAALTTFTVALDLATLPVASAATGTAFAAPTAQTFTYDSFHNTNALRVAIGKHHLTATITTPFWLDDDNLLYMDCTIVDPGTAVYDDYGARVNATLRL